MSDTDPAIKAAILRDEQRRMAEPADPSIREAVRRETQREADARHRANEAERRRQAATRAELAQEKQRRLEAWMAAGNDPDAFETMWIKQRQEVFLERQAVLRREASVF